MHINTSSIKTEYGCRLSCIKLSYLLIESDSACYKTLGRRPKNAPRTVQLVECDVTNANASEVNQTRTVSPPGDKSGTNCLDRQRANDNDRTSHETAQTVNS